MSRRVLATIVAAGAIAAAIGAAPSAVAAPAAVTSACPSGEICVWSGPGYTGTMAVVPQDPWECVTAASLGLPGIRSAKRNGVQCSIQSALYADSVCGRPTSPDTIGSDTADVSPAALSLENVQIPC